MERSNYINMESKTSHTEKPVIHQIIIENDKSSNESKELEAKPQSTLFQPWYEPGTTTKEKTLIFKLDFLILTYSCLAWLLKKRQMA